MEYVVLFGGAVTTAAVIVVGMAALTTRVRAAIKLREWRADPVLFCVEVLGFHPWDSDAVSCDTQADVMRAAALSQRVAIRSGHKCGKLLADDTLIATPSGWRRHGDLRAGDHLFDERGLVCTIVATKRWDNRPLMRVTFEDGTHIDADEAHEWLVRSRESRKPRSAETPSSIMETRQMSDAVDVPNGCDHTGKPRRIANWTIDLPGALHMPEQELPLDPYLLGLWLGDGSTGTGVFTGIDGLEGAFRAAGFTVNTSTKRPETHYVLALIPRLREAGVLRDKHVPTAYLWAAKEQRQALLQGLMDTDGCVDEGGRCEFTNTNERIAAAVLQLTKSLGLKSRMSEGRASFNGKDCGPKWRVMWSSPFAVFRLPRKLARLRTRWDRKANAHKRIAVTRIERLPGRHSGQCLEVDSQSSLYLAGESMVPTHNSRICAALALWEFVCWPGSRTIITAPTHRQIENIIWRELVHLYTHARIPIGGTLHKTPGKGLIHPKYQTQVIGFSTNEADRVSGISGPRVTWFVDEASGVDQAVFTAIEGNRAAGAAARLVMISNPTQPTGEFYDAFHSKARFYTRLHISSRQVAHARAKGLGRFPKKAGLADLTWVREKIDEWGEDSDELRVRCDGEFAKSGAQSIVMADDYDAAVLRWEPMQTEWRSHRLELGVDVAHFGDDTSAIIGRRGRHVFPPKGHMQLDGPQLALKVWNYVQLHRQHTDHSAVTKKPRVRVETVGVGVSCYDTLRHQYGEWLEVVAFNPSSSASDPEKYINLRAEAWFNARKVLSVAPYQLPEHGRMREETLAPHYLYDPKNRYQAESKKNIKKRMKQSPDFGDALIICLWDPPEGHSRTVRIPGL